MSDTAAPVVADTTQLLAQGTQAWAGGNPAAAAALFLAASQGGTHTQALERLVCCAAVMLIESYQREGALLSAARNYRALVEVFPKEPRLLLENALLHWRISDFARFDSALAALQGQTSALDDELALRMVQVVPELLPAAVGGSIFFELVRISRMLPSVLKPPELLAWGQAAAAPAPVLILGMHRSGTSLLASMLQDLGVWLGPSNYLVGPLAENQEGFFENTALVAVNEELLSLAGGAWDCVPESAGQLAQWAADPNQPVTRRALLALAGLRHTAPAGTRWYGFKDPRSCLTLDFWGQLLAPAYKVLVVRHPLAVAKSLQARGGYATLRHGMKLWLDHHQAVWPDVQQGQVLVVHHRDLLADPVAVAARMAHYLGANALPAAWLEQAGRRLKKDLVHQHAAEDSLDELPNAVARVYRQLCEAARQAPQVAG